MKTKVWQRSIASWMFIPAVVWAVMAGPTWWLLPAFLVYLTIALTITVGYHRLFTHNAFVCSRFWHWFFASVGSATLNSAPVHWSSVHINHHRYSDTKDDPYDADLRHFFRFKERENIKASKNELRMMRDKMHVFFVNHSLTVSILTGIILSLISFEAFFYLFALPTTTYLVTAGLHTIFAHGTLKENDERFSAARNLWLLEFIVPMGGEWIHKEHHDKPKLMDWNTKPHYFDLGAIMIALISKNTNQAVV
jgi:fatty-acid desaturase